MSPSTTLRPIRFDGDRRHALALATGEGGSPEAFASDVARALDEAERDGALLAYGLVARAHVDAVERLGFSCLGAAPALVRPLRISALASRLGVSAALSGALPGPALVAPFGGKRSPAVREITAPEPRVTRLWDRYSIDIGFAAERNARWVDARVFERLTARGYRVLVFEDGERYVIRAMCIYRVDGAHGWVAELLHDRTVPAMRAASHLLGLALRDMSARGVAAVSAWSLPHSGSSPMYMRHAFLPAARAAVPGDLVFYVRAIDPRVEGVATERHRWFLSGLDLEDV